MLRKEIVKEGDSLFVEIDGEKIELKNTKFTRSLTHVDIIHYVSKNNWEQVEDKPVKRKIVDDNVKVMKMTLPKNAIGSAMIDGDTISFSTRWAWKYYYESLGYKVDYNIHHTGGDDDILFVNHKLKKMFFIEWGDSIDEILGRNRIEVECPCCEEKINILKPEKLW